MKVGAGAVWNQSCTYIIFTLLPILAFALVSLWKMKVSHDNEMTQIQWQLDMAKDELNKSVHLYNDAEVELRQKKQMMTTMINERSKLENKTNILKDGITLVEDKVLNLTSKLLLKEVEAGIEKEENRKLLETIGNMKKMAVNEQTKNDLLALRNFDIEPIEENPNFLNEDLDNIIENSTIVKTSLETTTQSVLAKSTSSLEEIKSSSEKALEQSVNNSDDQKDDIVNKIMEIKHKQQELNDAKEQLFSNINKTDAVEVIKDAGNEDSKISIDVEIRDNLPMKKAEESKQKEINLPTNNTSVLKPIEREEISKIVEIDKRTDNSTTVEEPHLETTTTLISSSSLLTETSSHTEKAVEYTVNTADEVVNKIIEIKHKEQELDIAKEDLFSNSNKTEMEGTKDLENKDTKINFDVEMRENDPIDFVKNITNAVMNNTDVKLIDNTNEKKIHIILDVNDQTENKEPVTENN